MIPLVILAGGRATRLGAQSVERPKFLAPLQGQKVFADVQLAWVAAQGFRDVTLSVGYRAEMIEQAIGDGSRFGLTIRYVEDGPTPLGTGGAVRRAMASLNQQVAILYGDTMLEVNCAEVVKAAQGTDALMTVIACPSDQVANADFADGRVRYEKRSPDPSFRYIDYGLSLVSPGFLAEIPADRANDLADTFAAFSKRGALAGYLATQPFREINTPEALEAFRAWAK
jgi:NDP-sugar pyrophosphorylase family protein